MSVATRPTANRAQDEVTEEIELEVLADLEAGPDEDQQLLGDEDEGSSVPTELGFRILPRRAFWSASIILGTAIIAIGLIVIASIRVMNHEETRQFRCLQNGEHGAICAGSWDNQTCVDGVCSPDPCGSKLLVGLDISVAGAMDGNSTAVDALAELMIGWSLIPYLTILFLLAGALLLRSTAALAPLGLFLVIAALNEGVVKRLLRSPRPVGSCMFGLSYGMPSGHAASSIGLLTYLLLEILCDRPKLSGAVKGSVSLLLLLALAPVPASRVYLQDHTPAQAAAGAIAGAALGAAWFAGLYGGVALRALPPAHLSAIGRAWQRLGIRHTYRRRSAPLLLVLGVWSPNHHDQPPPPEIKAPGFSA